MGVKRYLGAAWASVHGPSAPRELALWVLQLGFGGILPAPAKRPVDWVSLRRCGKDLPFDFGGALRLAAHDAAVDRPDAGLASRDASDRAAAIAALAAASEQAIRLGVSHVVCEPGCVPLGGDPGPVDLGDAAVSWSDDRARAQIARRNVGLDAALDVACRSLFAVCRRYPEITFCLGPSAHVAGLGTPDALEAIFADLASHRLAYWHDAPIAVRRHELLGEDQGNWLERFAPRTAGLTLGDAQGAELRLPPGAGLVDFPLLASYMSPATLAVPVVVELDPDVPIAEIPRVHSFLSKFGL